MTDKPPEQTTSYTITLSGMSARLLLFADRGVKLLILCAALGIAWRYLDLYEVTVRAQSVEAQINLERHRLFMGEVQRQNAALTPEQITSTVAADLAQTGVAGGSLTHGQHP